MVQVIGNSIPNYQSIDSTVTTPENHTQVGGHVTNVSNDHRPRTNTDLIFSGIGQVVVGSVLIGTSKKFFGICSQDHEESFCKLVDDNVDMQSFNTLGYGLVMNGARNLGRGIYSIFSSRWCSKPAKSKG